MCPAEPPPYRRLTLAGAVNLRDLGGYRAARGRQTRWRTLYRSDSLAELTAPDQDALAALGLRTICDLRIEDERMRKPNRLPHGQAVRIVERGFLPEGTLEMLARIDTGELRAEDIRAEVLRHYPRFIRDHAEEYAALFALILEADSLPLLFHCTSGKDRTGIGAALILLALGVSRDTVVADYVLTNAYRRDIRHLFDSHVDDAALEALTAADPAYIGAALDEIDRQHGSPARFFEALGLDRAALDALHDRLTV